MSPDHPGPAADLVRDLAGIRVQDAGLVGPKMARLGQLAQAGWRVPDGYAITASALSGWLPARVRQDLERLAGGGHAARARELIGEQPLPAWLEDAVAAAHERLAGRTGRGAALQVAVRSSAICEDGASASFAGQYATFLGVSGLPSVLRHIRECWASGFTVHALAYRRRAAAPAGHHMAVGVLELVEARSAGVAFTVDPVTGDRERLVVEANWGLGESVVSGQVTPDHWEVDRATGRILAEHVTAKRAWTALDPGTGAATLQPLPPEIAAQGCLAPHEVRYLCRQAVAIEDAQDGAAQDVEWAIARGLPFPDSVFILQHRPVTTLTVPPQAVPPEAVPAQAASPQAPSPSAAAEPPLPRPAFDPVQYALRNVFKVPGT